jgi:hypothetical protein
MRFLKLSGKRFVAGGLVAAIGVLALASTASASVHHPKGEYSGFGECPLNRVTITDCILSVSKGGSFVIGKKSVPLVNPVTLQGGFEGSGEAVKFYGAENGETLSKTPQPVPGGLIGITAPTSWPKSIQEWFNKQINEGLTGVTATVELTGPSKGLTNIKLSTENLLTRTGTALGLPAKIKLSNPILGNSCYIGSESSPVQINFTTGKSGALEGVVGEVGFNPEFTIITIKGGKLVNGTYAAPGVSGCGGIFSFLVDPLVDSVLGTPSPSGKNTAILEGVLQDAQAEAVKASE